MLRRRFLFEWWATALIASGAVVGTLLSGLGDRTDNLLLDEAQSLAPPPASNRILILNIGNESLKQIGKWPWPRSIHAEMLQRLNAMRPASIAYDVLFQEPAPGKQDLELAAAINDSNSKVFLPVLIEVPGRDGAAQDTVPPIPILRANAVLGSVNLLFDSDGLIRRLDLDDGYRTNGPLPLMEELYLHLKGTPSTEFRRVTGGPAGHDMMRTSLIPFRPAGSFRTVEFSDVLAGRVPEVFIRDRIVLVGASAEGLGDNYPVPGPAGHVMPGIEIQANVLNGLLANRFVRPLPIGLVMAISLLPLWLLMLCFLKLRPTSNLRLSLAIMMTWLAAALSAPAFLGVWLAPTAGIVGLLLVYPLWGWRRLEALNAFVSRELALVRREPDILPSQAAIDGGDTIARQAQQLHLMVGQLIDLRRLVATVLTNMPDAICVLDVENRVLMANDAAHQLFQKDPLRQDFEQLLAGIAKPAEDRKTLLTIDDKVLLLSRVPLTIQHGGSIVRLVDITALREAAAEREQTLQFLSHDMRAPQSAILALLDQDLHDPSAIDHIRRYARQTLRLADDFVSLARARLEAWQPKLIDIGDALDEAIDLVWAQAREGGIHIDRNAHDNCLIDGDFAMLTRAFANLLDNAIKFSPYGSVVRCVIERDNKTIRCLIKDSGPGLASERQVQPFEAFGARKPGGVGLGLAFVKVATERHRGTLEWSSSAAEGTEFRLAFPVAENEFLNSGHAAC